MRNKKYLLGNKIPKKVRLDVYKRAIDYYKNILIHEIIEFDKLHIGTGLCIVLPCCLWGLKSFKDNGPNGIAWAYWKTDDSFIETKSLIHFLISKCDSDIMEKIFMRYYGLCNIVFEMTGEVLIDENLYNKYHYVNVNYKVLD